MADFSDQRKALGAFIRSQRQLANLSLRQMAALADISNPYLSQIERGLHQPSVQVLRSLAHALNLSAETLLAHSGLMGEQPSEALAVTEQAIRADAHLNAEQKSALLAVYRSYRAANTAAAGEASPGPGGSGPGGSGPGGAASDPSEQV